MNVVVSVSEMRSNISEYLDKVAQGARVFIRDEKRQKTVAQLVKVGTFDKESYGELLERVAGIFSGSQHPEWRSTKLISEWLVKSRTADERKF